MKKIFILWAMGSFALLAACNVKYFENAQFGDVVFDPSIAVVFGELTYTVDELFEQLDDQAAGLTTNDDGVITIVYNEQLQSQSAQDFLQVQDQVFGSSLPVGVNVNNPGVSSTITVTEVYEFDLSQRGDEAYDSIYFQAGLFEFTVESDINADIDFVATFTSLESSGTTLTMNGSLSPGNNTFNQTEDLNNYIGYFHLDESGNVSSNKFLVEISYDVEVTPTSIINSSDRVGFNVGMTNTSFNNVYGFVDSQELEVSFEIVDLDFFDRFDSGDITFADPRVGFVFENSFGFPLGVNFQQISAVASNGQTINLEGDIIEDLNQVAGPRIVNEGATRTTEVTIDKDNSNIVDLLSSKPERIVVDVFAQSNPDGVPFQYNFVNEESILNVGVDLEIPFDMNIDGLIAEENMSFSPPEDIDQAKRFLVRLISENELPLSGLVEMQFLNSQGNVVHTVDQQPVFEAAEVGSDGRTGQPAEGTSDIILEEGDIESIKDAVSIRLLVTLSTTDADQGASVILYDDYELRFKVAGQLDLELNSNGN